MSTISHQLEKAIGHHRSGELASAEAIYRQIIRIEPRHADALHLLGVAAAARNHQSEAISYIRRSLAVSPRFAGAHYNLGRAYEAQNQLAEASESYREALRLDPSFVDAWNNLGRLLFSKGQTADAIECYRHALSIQPEHFEVHYNLGNALHEIKELSAAEYHLREALRGVPDLAAVHNNLGAVLKSQERFEAARECFSQAVLLDPHSVEAHNNLGTTREFLGDLDKASFSYQRALELNPEFCGAHINLANLLNERGELSAAIRGYERAIGLNPNSAEAQFNLALARIRSGDFEQGWEAYEWRFARKVTPRQFDLPVWDGSPLPGRSILVYAEQGIGDEVMFASCLPEIIAAADQCVVECEQRLVPLFSRSFPTAEVVERPIDVWGNRPGSAKPLGCLDVQSAFGSLPCYLRRTEADFPKRQSYLQADPARVANWQARFASLGPGIKIGISWRGGEELALRRKRSTQLLHWRQIAEVANVHCINLQYGEVAGELEDFRQQTGIEIHDWADSDPLTDLDDYTAQIAALDLVISVDNSTVHLAGALGVEVWTMLPFASDWRWLVNRDDTPWYPGMRLFRQAEQNDWRSLFQRLSEELIARRAALLPLVPHSRTDQADTQDHFSLGNQQQANGDLIAAEQCYRRALERKRDHFGARFNLANVLLGREQIDEAIDCFERALKMDRAYAPHAYTNIGIVLRKLGRFDVAETYLQRALAEDSEYAEAHGNLGNVLVDQNRTTEAIDCYRRALQFRPGYAEAHNNLGNAYKQLGNIDEAIASYRRAVQSQPDYVIAYNNLGTLLHEQDQLPAAIACYQRALQIQPIFPDATTNLGIARIHNRQPAEALKNFNQALKVEPDHVEAHFYRSVALLTLGDFSQGWPEYEYRWRRNDLVPRSFSQPVWEGASLTDKTILVHTEQGTGDEIMFASCLPDLLVRTKHCLVECDPRLVPLFARSFPQASVTARPEDFHSTASHRVESADYQIALGSLPRLLRTGFDSFPRQERYLVADPLQVRSWQDRFAALGEGLKIGISWRGGKQFEDRRRRSTTLDQWKPILALPGLQFVSLQYGDVTEDLDRAEATIHRWEQGDVDPLLDLDTFAAKVAALDLVISIDNATVHLAGALGIRVWTLLPYAAEWRWLLGRDETPWYPSMRLFRQQAAGDWNDLFRRVADTLLYASA